MAPVSRRSPKISLQLDATEGVTITLTGKQDATEQLASGGLLVCHQ